MTALLEGVKEIFFFFFFLGGGAGLDKFVPNFKKTRKKIKKVTASQDDDSVGELTER